MTCIRSWKSHRLTSHTWLGLNPQIRTPLSTLKDFWCHWFLVVILCNLAEYSSHETEIYETVKVCI
jgi:hypothetical protein